MKALFSVLIMVARHKFKVIFYAIVVKIFYDLNSVGLYGLERLYLALCFLVSEQEICFPGLFHDRIRLDPFHESIIPERS